MECFSIYCEDIEERIDPLFYSGGIFQIIKKSPFEIKTINDVSLYLNTGFPAGLNLQDSKENGIIQIRPTNIGEDCLLKFDKNIYLKKEYVDSKKSNLLKKNDILFNNTNSQELVGKTAFFDLDGEYFCSNHITRIGVNDELIYPKYLWIILNLYQSHKNFYKICTNWNNQSGINKELLNDVKIPLPPLKVQEKLIAIMQNVYDLRKKKDDEAKALFDSIDDFVLDKLGIKLPDDNDKMCYSVTSDALQNDRIDPYYYQPTFKKLDYVIGTLNYKSLDEIVHFSNETWNQEDTFEDKFPYIEISQIDINFGIVKDITYYEKINAPSRAKMIVREGDIIISTTRPHRGAISMIDESKNGFIASTGFAVLRKLKTNEIEKNFLYTILRTRLGLQQMLRRSSGGNYPAITSKELKKIKIPLPNKNVQNAISDEVKFRMDKAKLLQQEAQEMLENAKIEVEKIIMGD